MQASRTDGAPHFTAFRICGKACQGTWIPWAALGKGAVLRYATAEEPSKSRGTEMAPPAFQQH